MKNHLSENVRRLRQIQRRCKQKEAESHKPVKAMWKSEKYDEIQSRIKQELQVNDQIHLKIFSKCHFS